EEQEGHDQDETRERKRREDVGGLRAQRRLERAPPEETVDDGESEEQNPDPESEPDEASMDHRFPSTPPTPPRSRGRPRTRPRRRRRRGPAGRSRASRPAS